jgi:DNA-binding winged helix-turn-helix (wHTH) protein/Tol biopolymer transport system component
MHFSPSKTARLQVGEFEVDLQWAELRHNGEKVKLQERPFQILAALLDRPGEIVTREEIKKKLWSDTVVDFEHSINTAVNKLREALGDNVEAPRYIQTVPRYGYRLIARVETLAGNKIDPSSSPSQEAPEATPTRKRRLRAVHATLIPLAIAGVLLFLFALLRNNLPPHTVWKQVTNFSDSATSPAFSSDGRMLTFIRGPETFVTPGQIYVKVWPDGAAVQLTHDASRKQAPVFSLDGSRIAYTATDADNYGWNTWAIPVLGGEPERLLPNAAALTWADKQHVLFSEAKSGWRMGVYTAAESRDGEREVYMPKSTGGMAHRSWLSPDGKWVLISEMDKIGWRPCAIVAFFGNDSKKTVGPPDARCTYAGWSPDGQMMYFSADAGDGFHIWRQLFPDRAPEQMTFGPTEEEGVAVSPDGQTLVTSAGIRISTVWLRDKRGDRQISAEGYATVPGLGFGGTDVHAICSPDGKRLFYLVRKGASREYNSGELWVAELDSGRTEVVLPGILMSEFDVSPDGDRIAFAAFDKEGSSHVWVASLDRSSPPRQLTMKFARKPYFRAEGNIYFLIQENDQEYVYRVGPKEIAPQKVSSQAVDDFKGISPSGNWWLSGFNPVLVHPANGGPPVRLCNFCAAGWSSDGKVLYVRFREMGEAGGGRTMAIGLPVGRELPNLPASGLKSVDDLKGLNVVADLDMQGIRIFAPGNDPSAFAYVRTTVQRNLFSMPISRPFLTLP